jgi:two-component system sensor histidine kinase KdpD
VEVLDEGVGVPEAELEHIFDKFYRAGQKTQSGLNYSIPGSGLGLAICKGIIEAHCGLIWAKPRPYGGSVFAFWLPAAPLPEAALSPEDNNSSSDIVLHIAE